MRAFRALAPLVAALAAACGSGGGEATIAIPREPATVVDWCTADETEADLAGLLFRKLARPGPAPGTWVEDLAASWEVLPDGRSIRVTLREGLTWEDGEPMTSKDVVFSQESARAPGSSLAAAKRDIVAVAAEGPRTVVFRTKGDARAALAAAFAGGVYPARYLEGVPVDRVCTDPFNDAPVGSGPFRLEERRPGEALRFVRRDGVRPTGEPGHPRLASLRARILLDRAAIRDALDRGEVDYVELFPGEDASRMSVPGKTRLVEGSGRSVYALAWNTARRPFDLPGVRRGLALALGSVAERAKTRQVLEDAGLRHNAGGEWLGADGRPLIVSLMTDVDAASRGTAATIAAALGGIGLTVETRSGSPEDLRARVREGDWSARLLRLPAEDSAGEPDWTLLHAATSRAVVRQGLAGPEENPRRPLAAIERWRRGR